MGWRLYRRKQLIPGVRLNISRSRPSIRLGPRGAGITLGGRSGLRATAGVPGSGVYYTATAHRRRQRALPSRRSYSAPPGSGSNRGTAIGCLWLIGIVIGLALVIVTYGLILIPVAAGGIGWFWWKATRPEAKGARLIARAQTLPGDQAVLILHEAIAVDPEGTKTLEVAGDWFSDNLCWEDAAECFAGALHSRQDWELEAGYVRALVFAGRFDEAIPRLEQHLQMDWLIPESRAMVASLLAIAFLGKGDPSQALALVSQQPLQLHNLDLGLQQCLYLRAVCRYLIGQKAKAIGDLERLYAINPGYTGVADSKSEMTAGTYSFGEPKPYPDWYPHAAVVAVTADADHIREGGALPPSDKALPEVHDGSLPMPPALGSPRALQGESPLAPVEPPSDATRTTTPTPTPNEVVYASPPTSLSPDGKWRWNGSAWVPVDPPSG